VPCPCLQRLAHGADVWATGCAKTDGRDPLIEYHHDG
jgi:hypothetical protein